MICEGVHNKIYYNKNPTCFSVLLIRASNMSSNLSTCWMIDLDKIDSLRIILLNYKILGYKECVRIVMMSVVCVSALFSWSGLWVLRFSQVDSSFFSFFKWFFFQFHPSRFNCLRIRIYNFFRFTFYGVISVSSLGIDRLTHIDSGHCFCLTG